ncbi:hypothetical protein KP509_04G104400 [Ceratopteris richardii]|nr:hypothetical protein KP509_04G104400 [Ceratopteris richardii]
MLYLCLLRACSKNKDLCAGTRLHAEILQNGLFEKNLDITRSLLSMYAKCHEFRKAEALLYELAHRDVFSWNVVIGGYVQCGRSNDALKLFNQMRLEDCPPDKVTFTSILKACSTLRDLSMGEKIHDYVARRGLVSKDIILATTLLNMYVNCGVLRKAQKVLDELPSRDSFCWTTIIKGYIGIGQYEYALKCFKQMRDEDISPDTVTFTCVLKACASIGALDKGKEIHQEVVSLGMLGKDVLLDNALVDMYVKCLALDKAREILESTSTRSITAWISVIEGYFKNYEYESVISCFEQMIDSGICPNELVYIFVLKACGSIGAYEKGEKFHENIKGKHFLRNNLVINTSIIDMYSKCAAFTKAREVLEKQCDWDVVSWNALITGYAKHQKGDDVLSCYREMQVKGLVPDEVTYCCILKACSILCDLNRGQQVYDEVVRKGFLKDNSVLITSIIDMYVKCGELTKAQQVLKDHPTHNVIAWNALLSGYIQHGLGEDTICCYEEMLQKGLVADDVTFTCLLKACSIVGDVTKGKQIHEVISNKTKLSNNFVLFSTLVDMYVKCGELGIAWQVVKENGVSCVILWNVLITGYALQGQAQTSMSCFEHMQASGFCPNAATFSSLLNACSHAGLVDEGQNYFVSMVTCFGILPHLDHCACMIDLFGRAGNFEEAVAFTELVPSSNISAIWFAILGACKKWGSLTIARWAFHHAVQAHDTDIGVYICMGNVYASAENWEDLSYS